MAETTDGGSHKPSYYLISQFVNVICQYQICVNITSLLIILYFSFINSEIRLKFVATKMRHPAMADEYAMNLYSPPRNDILIANQHFYFPVLMKIGNINNDLLSLFCTLDTFAPKYITMLDLSR